jgi:UDP-glucose 4-epimerase
MSGHPSHRPFEATRVLVTGGLGFIGSSVALALQDAGALVTVVDNLSPNQGGNRFNIEEAKGRITVDYSDIRDEQAMRQLVSGQDYVFHLARQTDHILSQTDPFPDIDVNIRGTAVILEALKHHNAAARFVYVGTRGQYGAAITLPVAEDAPTNPKGVYELTNLAGEKLVKIYHDIHGIRSVMLRLTNVYGPRAQMKTDHFGVVNWFVRQALDGNPIRVFGDGKLKRDFLYIDDAVDGVLAAAACDGCYGEVVNVGSDEPTDFLTLVKTLTAAVPGSRWEFAPFTRERAAQEPGDFSSDITKIRRLTGWTPTTPLSDGLARTVAFYRKYRDRYW